MVGGHPADGPAHLFPHSLLACILADVPVKRRAIDLDDEPEARPAEVRLLTGYPDVEARKRAIGGAKHPQCADLGPTSCALQGQAGIPGSGLGESAGSAASAVPPHMFGQLWERHQL